MAKGKFITFEGGEGTGKSTQLKLLAARLEELNIPVIQTKEPGGTELGLELRKMLVTGDKDKMDAVAEALLYYADRRIHLTKKIWPAIGEGKWVMSDRFADSSVAYQYYGYNKRVPFETLENLYKLAVGDFKPDLTILLDLDPKIGLARSMEKAGHMAVQETRHESRELEFHQRLREGYLEMAQKEPERFIVLNADCPIEKLHKEIVAAVTERFGLN